MIKNAVMLMLKQLTLLVILDAIGTPKLQMIVENMTATISKPKNYVVHANNLDYENRWIKEHFIWLQLFKYIRTYS